MKISARVVNREGKHRVNLQTNDIGHTLEIPPKQGGLGSGVNGGELLFLALATCYCNDLYREAGKRGIKLNQVEVDVEGEFGAPGEPAQNVSYRARIAGDASEAELQALMRATDQVAEIQNTLRVGTPVIFVGGEVIGS
jgi:uncharacterized OsmC-like protein